VVELAPLRLERVGKPVHLHEQRIEHRAGHDPHGGGEGVIGALAVVDVIVGVDLRVIALLAAQDLLGAVREHLVDVHVERRAGSHMEDVHRELVAERTLQDLVGGLHDGPPLLGVK
jgi:hypothetical protein